MTKEEIREKHLRLNGLFPNKDAIGKRIAKAAFDAMEEYAQQVAKEAAADGWVNIDSYLEDNGVNPHEVAVKGKEIAEKILLKQGSSYINYGALIEDKLYPVVYTVLQSGEKLFEPKWISGKDLTEPQIKYLYDLGYFSKR